MIPDTVEALTIDGICLGFLGLSFLRAWWLDRKHHREGK